MTEEKKKPVSPAIAPQGRGLTPEVKKTGRDTPLAWVPKPEKVGSTGDTRCFDGAGRLAPKPPTESETSKSKKSETKGS